MIYFNGEIVKVLMMGLNLVKVSVKVKKATDFPTKYVCLLCLREVRARAFLISYSSLASF